MQETEGLQKLTLDNQRKLFMSGVESVDAFSERELKLTLNGSRVLVGGEGIKITAFNKGNGSLTADGKFTYIRYDVQKAPLLKRIFK
ncbi:MAG: hypothetical protein DBX59_10440 [Bacillota bacterium]|nr:MAG: hypothetical protein DBX59_10440 [Bacillota bacterium]